MKTMYLIKSGARGAGAPAGRRGTALVPTLVVVVSMAIFSLAMVMSSLSGAKTVNHQSDEYFLASAVESAAIVTVHRLWSDFLQDNGGAAGTISDFRNFLTGEGITDSGPGGAPTSEEGFDLLSKVGIPGADSGNPELNNVNIEALQVVRRDDGDATQLWITVAASTNRGQGIVSPMLNRAVQQVYTIQPEKFGGFDFGILANNVNCVFCHTTVDSVERYYNHDPDNYGTYDRVKVGTLESLMIRNEMDGKDHVLNDFDADSYVAGTVYVRGHATDHDGEELGSWQDLTFGAFEFDESGKILQDSWGGLEVAPFEPAGTPPDPLENLYLGYPATYAEMVDGNLPTMFPAPIPDDGGIDEATGLPDETGAGNKIVDPEEFFAAAKKAKGSISGGVITEIPPGYNLNSVADYTTALELASKPSISSLGKGIEGNVILTGTLENPLILQDTVAISGDVIISGYVKGKGTIIASGNIYIPSDLQYVDGKHYLPGDLEGQPTGPETFGIDPDGKKNTLGLAAGGNVLIGDYMKPSTLQPDLSYELPGKYEVVTGDDDGPWNFGLAEISLFNRGEWAKTQPFLPGPGDVKDIPSTWSISNSPEFGGTYEGADYVPRYYGFGPGDKIPLYIEGNIYWDPTSKTWKGDTEVPIGWDEDLLAYADPNDPTDLFLYAPDGSPKAVVKHLTSTDGWMDDFLYKLYVEYYEGMHTPGEPLRIDGLIYTNNAIFSLVHRASPYKGKLLVNGALVAADLGMLAPGRKNGDSTAAGTQPNSPFETGLQLNYDRRVKNMLNVLNPYQVQLKRTLWNPTVSIL